MRLRFSAGVATVFAAAALGLLSAAPASATNFCVGFTGGDCPAGATFVSNVTSGLEMGANAALANDGIPDRVFIPAGTQLPSSGLGFEPAVNYSATDDLEVIGAGRDSTILTTNASTNIYVINLTPIPNRKITVRDLTIRVPASFPDGPGYGAAIQENDDVFTRVNFESRNTITPTHSGSNGVFAINGATFNDVRFFGSSGGGFNSAIQTGNFSAGDSLEITGSDIVDFQGGISPTGMYGLPVNITKSHFRSDYATVLGVYDGPATITNSVIEAGPLTPLFVQATNGTSPDASLVVKNSTILGLGGATKAFDVGVGNTANGNATATVSDSIVYGFPKTWSTTAPVGIYGQANFDIRYSNFENPGDKTGDGTVTSSVGNISQNPGFVGLSDYHLSPTSPSIDAGDPAVGGILDDIAGTVRPLDGNGDGTAVRDQGAYEAQAVAPPSCANTPALCPPPGDTTAPKLTKLKLKVTRKKTARITYSLDEAANVRVTFAPKPKKKRKAYTVSRKSKAGANTFLTKRGKLKPGRYRVTLVAIDVAGNKAKAIVRVVKVKKPRR